jgi:two-component system chemotaxis response regulator CheY
MKILIVDDSKAMRMLVRRALRQAGYDKHDVEEAANGAEALQRITAAKPDLVISDWNMPEMSGIDLLGRITEARMGVRFGFVTSESSPEMRVRAEQAGALFLLAKPFTPEGIRGALEPILGAG